MLAIHFYKFYGGLLYPPHVWNMEFAGYLLILFVQMIRIEFGFYANRQESANWTFIFIQATALSLYVFIHYSTMATYVLLIEILINSIAIIFCFMELILATIAFCNIWYQPEDR